MLYIRVGTKSQNNSAGEKKRTMARCVIPTYKIFQKSHWRVCVVFHTQLMAGSHGAETVVALHQSLLNVLVDGEARTSGSSMIDFSLFDCCCCKIASQE